jgi:diguanylate cyclase (GGDEF)-like protein
MLKLSLFNKLGRRFSACFTDEQQRKTILAQLFSAVALLFLLIFSIDALVNDNTGHALVLLIFALLTIANYMFLKLARQANIANLLIIVLMGSLCLYLFYTGGVAGTGPLWSFVFIPVAIFLGGIRAGVIAVALLMTVILVLYQSLQIDMHEGMYASIFMVRFVAIYTILAILSFCNEYFREGSQRHLQSAYQRLESLFRTDELTGLYNLRHIMEQLAYETLRMRRKNTPFCVILFDIDHFKQINDRYGHACGDYVLQSMAMVVQKAIRSMDIVARVGGEEFLILLPDTHLHSAAVVAERIRKEMEQYAFIYGEIPFRVTVSLGVTEARNDLLPEGMLRMADENLYKAKNRGRNRMVAS